MPGQVQGDLYWGLLWVFRLRQGLVETRQWEPSEASVSPEELRNTVEEQEMGPEHGRIPAMPL